MVAGNTDKLMSYYSRDAISMPNYEKMLEGIDAIRKSNEEMIKAGWKCVKFEPKTLKATTCGNQVIEIGTFVIAFTGPGMEKPFEDVGKYLTVWEKQTDGSYKMKIETWNSDMNPMEK
jgi:ketosteroid isomerase-like protein